MTTSLSKTLTQAMAACDLSKRGLAIAAGVSYPTVLNIFNKGSSPRRSILERLATALDLDADDLAPGGRTPKQTAKSRKQPHSPQAPPPSHPLQAALREHQQRAGLSIQAMAERCDISPVTMAKYLRGDALPSHAGTHRKLQRFLDLDTDSYGDLFARPAAPTSAQTPTTTILAPDDQDFLSILRQLNTQQRTTLLRFLQTLI